MSKGIRKNGTKLGFQKGYKQTKQHRINIGIANKGKKKPPRTKEHTKKVINSLLGNQRVKGKHWRLSKITRIKMSKSARVVWSMRGGINNKNLDIRKCIEYRLWREVVFTRNNWTCQKCGQIGGCLHPHHIFNFATYLDLRFNILNGITLCKGCHRKLHNKYGNRNNTKEQLEEFLKDVKSKGF